MDCIANVDQLEDALSAPTPAVLEMIARGQGDLIVLGVAGKMGPTLARMAARAFTETGRKGKVVGVSRFSNPAERDKLNAWGIETITGDLLDEAFVAQLPLAGQVVFMAGMKFGSSGNESLTWAMNTLLPANVCRRYKDSAIAAFSTGNVYGMVPLASGGSIETDAPNPDGEYAISCLGRERVFEHYSRSAATKVSILRLNYACELRYGVLVDLAQKIHAGKTIDLSMGMANVIWQRDANAMSLLSLEQADTPPFLLNIAGPEQLSIRRICAQLGQRLGKAPVLTGHEASEALLNNGQKGHRLYGYPTCSIDWLMDQVAHWILQDGELLGKATKFEVRDGKF